MHDISTRLVMPLKFGDHDKMIEMIKLMAYNQGFEKTLRRAVTASQKYGHPEIAALHASSEFPWLRSAASQAWAMYAHRIKVRHTWKVT
ncbi:MAG: hypothetical protein IPN96_12050 [Anaerolineales bacterium]|nr:hypothetical protein [Anaerolineales bacterium]